jgi:hypothetical protein
MMQFRDTSDSILIDYPRSIDIKDRQNPTLYNCNKSVVGRHRMDSSALMMGNSRIKNLQDPRTFERIPRKFN